MTVRRGNHAIAPITTGSKPVVIRRNKIVIGAPSGKITDQVKRCPSLALKNKRVPTSSVSIPGIGRSAKLKLGQIRAQIFDIGSSPHE
jgi:hypothetical protein